jgi:propanol-preferring alcohol dehydrogenase
MKAMALKQITNLAVNRSPLELVDVPIPVPKEHELLVKVSVCGVCHTELDEIEGRTPPAYLPIIPGHQVIGHVAQAGGAVRGFKKGDRIGIA